MRASEERQNEELPLLTSSGGHWRDEIDTEDLDGLIELVAHTNQLHAVPEHTLPEVRASPCAMHSRRHRHDLDLLYATNCHGGKVGTLRLMQGGEDAGAGLLPERQRRVCHRAEGPFLAPAGRSLQDVSARHHSPTRPERGELGPIKEAGDVDRTRGRGAGQQNLTGSGTGSRTLLRPRPGKDGAAAAAGDGLQDNQSRSPRQQQLLQQNLQHQKLYQQQFQRRVSPAQLPGELPAEDVVLSWLKHGSVHSAKSQFPEIRRGADADCGRENTKRVF